MMPELAITGVREVPRQVFRSFRERDRVEPREELLVRLILHRDAEHFSLLLSITAAHALVHPSFSRCPERKLFAMKF